MFTTCFTQYIYVFRKVLTTNSDTEQVSVAPTVWIDFLETPGSNPE
jgi:hypothetical protein